MNIIIIGIIVIVILTIVLWIFGKYGKEKYEDVSIGLPDETRDENAELDAIKNLSPVYADGTPCRGAINIPPEFVGKQDYTDLSDTEKRKVHAFISKNQPYILDGKTNQYYRQFLPLVTDYGNTTLADNNTRVTGNETDPDIESEKYLSYERPYLIKNYGRYYYYNQQYPEHPIDIDFVVNKHKFMAKDQTEYPVPNVIRDDW